MSKTGGVPWAGARSLPAPSLLLLLPLAASLAACLSPAPPAPPVRWFDPSPAPAAAPTSTAAFRCRAAATVAREFVFRVGPRELVYDSEHRWCAEPAQLVEAALQAHSQQGAAAPNATSPLEVLVDAFEFDLVAAPTARVVVVLSRAGAVPRRLVGQHVASSTDPAALAEAMATALGDVVQQVLAAAAGAPDR